MWLFLFLQYTSYLGGLYKASVLGSSRIIAFAYMFRINNIYDLAYISGYHISIMISMFSFILAKHHHKNIEKDNL
jgi:hypothetical protein